MARFRAEYKGAVLGWYDSLQEAEAAIELADDPCGPLAFDKAVLIEEEFTRLVTSQAPSYHLV